MRSPLPVVALFAIALAIPPAAAGCIPTNSEFEVTTCGVGDVRCFYFDNDACQPECNMNVWIYEESNGIAGLQRFDENHDDTCNGAIPSDTIVF